MSNWKTTVAGAIIAIVYYLKTTGAQIPTTKAEAWNFAISLAFVALGLVAKDSDVTGGTRPNTSPGPV